MPLLLSRVLLPLLLCVSFVPTPSRAADTLSGRVDPAVAKALESSSRVRVLLLLETPADADKAGDRRASIARTTDAVLAGMAQKNVTLRRRFSGVPALALEIDADALSQLAQDRNVRRIELEVGGSGAMVESAPLARVDQTLAAGMTGAGSKIAIVDSGIDSDHADFTGRIVAEQCFCSGIAGSVGCCPNDEDTMSGPGSAEDDHGHGTNVAGIAGGGGAVAQRGAAPEATLLAVKVLDANNSFCCASDIVAAFDWISENHPDTDVVNASLGTSALFPANCDAAAGFTQLLAQAIANLTANGTQVFVSSGNQRSGTSIAAPACITGAFAVGAVWDADLGDVTVFSCTDSTAPDKATCFTNSNADVDLYAPGALVTSSGMGGGLRGFYGTSQATPLVAGCAAALGAAAPGATPDAIQAALKATPTTIVDPKNGLSFGRLDCAGAALLLIVDIFADGFED